MIFSIFKNEFDLTLNVLFWVLLATFNPALFFALYVNRPYAIIH
jgi:hypothetical protein